MPVEVAVPEKWTIPTPRENEVVLTFYSEGWRETMIVQKGESLTEAVERINKEHESVQG